MLSARRFDVRRLGPLAGPAPLGKLHKVDGLPSLSSAWRPARLRWGLDLQGRGGSLRGGCACLIEGTPELPNALTQGTGELREALGAEDQQGDDGDEQQMNRIVDAHAISVTHSIVGYWWIASPASSIATNFARRLARVSGFLASCRR